MTNNDIFKKLRVALMLRDDQIVEILELVDFRITKSELGAFFRDEKHENYMECGDQVLRNFLNALERIPSIIDQYKAKNEVLEKEVPQLQEIAGKVWKKEDELKQLKSELAALDRKIQLELAPPAQEVTEKEKNGQEIKPDAEGVRSISPQQTDDVPQIRSPMDKRSPSGNFIANHIIIGRPGFQFKDENRSKGIKI